MRTLFPRTSLKKIVLLCSFFSLLCAAPAFAKFDPAFTWTTLETPHFSIHYHQGGEEIAKRVAVIAEDVHSRLVPRIRWEPHHKTHLVLVDAMDDSNGLTTPLPYQHITLFLTQPLGLTGLGTMSYDEWMRLLITHEYTHILHLDMVTGIPEVIQDIFGRIYFPNLFEPIWMIEGLAVYEETEETSGGRGRSPGSDMVLRMAVLEDRFPKISQAANFPDSWPAGQVPYLFGEGFSRYIVEKYGREKLADVYVAYSGRGVPWLVDSTGRRVLHADYDDLWEDWHDQLRTRYERVRDKVQKNGPTVSQPLTTRGYMNIDPAFSPDGKRIAYTVLNADEFPGIYVMNADGSQDRRLVKRAFSATSSGQSVAWSPDGSGIYYTRIDYRRSTDLYNDIYFYDLSKGREVRITQGLRARDPYPSPDGTRLVFVTNRLGKTRLATLSLSPRPGRPFREKDVTFLTEESVLQYETPRYGPDGTRIVAGVWQPGGYKDIWILDGAGRRIEELTHDRAIDGDAIWSPDGKVIYFSSDRTGIFNLYAYDVAAKRITQVTNVLGGAFSPTVSPDGATLAFSSYSSVGYDLNRMPAMKAEGKPAEPYQDRYPVMTYADKPVETTTSPYNPLSTLVPRFWLPWYGASEASGSLWGFLTFDQDAVEHHTYMITGLYSPTTYRTWYTFDYAYDGFYPTLHLLAQDTDVTYAGLLSDSTGSTDYVERSRTIDASVIVPLLTLEHQHALTIGYRRRNVSALTTLPPWNNYSGPAPAEGILVSDRIDYQYNSAQQYGLSISPEDGRTIELGYERLDRSLGSDFNVTKYTIDWHEYIDFPWPHHVLLARGFAGTSSGDVLPQRAFQMGGDNPGDTTIPVDQEAIYLRGYPINAFRGAKAALGSLEYRFPLQNVESGWGNKPFFFRRLHGAIFAEAGNAWDQGFHSKDFKRSVGAEGRLDMYFSYYLPITVRFVVAKGLDEQRETLVYIALWTPAVF